MTLGPATLKGKHNNSSGQPAPPSGSIALFATHPGLCYPRGVSLFTWGEIALILIVFGIISLVGVLPRVGDVLGDFMYGYRTGGKQPQAREPIGAPGERNEARDAEAVEDAK